ncbi:uncharacterized protein LOC124406489 [Diprion similis]|uniref:uncharacterized protein LOC124406489 n=1 Tax=Diprion similis TaxID=362088 RepID=UPI001EF90B39|nr:uncharacterized protein LOC124406489 [Diprion similis]
MGKNKAHHKTKNVFKVAGARSLKHKKAKAQKVSTELKKLNVKSEKKSGKVGKTTEVDKQLVELRKEMLQGKPGKVVKETGKKTKARQNAKANTRMATRAQTEAAANLVEGMQI